MFPYKSMISIRRKIKIAVYLQISNQLIQLIKSKVLPGKTRLPSSRSLAVILGVHRKTIVAAYDELTLQGWVIAIPKRGTFVNTDIPLLTSMKIGGDDFLTRKSEPGFSFVKRPAIDIKISNLREGDIYIGDGIADPRLAPILDISKIYKSVSSKGYNRRSLSYGTTKGCLQLREVLVKYLNETRGLNVGLENIMITRGSQMGIFLASNCLSQKEGMVIVGDTNYLSADITLKESGAKLITAKVDGDGIDTREVEKICLKHKIKALYLTSHHHHPTTVTLTAQRRMHLLNLAFRYDFAIIEDDYDYDFHYDHSPILPLSSHDINGNVVYIGSICKTVAPVYRVGYLVGAKNFVDECAKMRRFVDRQGDYLLEFTFARFIKYGDLDRHIKKVLKVYKFRRDLFCQLLEEQLGTYFSFEIPKGGMAVWVVLDKKYNWDWVVAVGKQHNLEIGNWKRYDQNDIGHHGIRMGFSVFNEEEINELIKRLRLTMRSVEATYLPTSSDDD